MDNDSPLLADSPCCGSMVAVYRSYEPRRPPTLWKLHKVTSREAVLICPNTGKRIEFKLFDGVIHDDYGADTIVESDLALIKLYLMPK